MKKSDFFDNLNVVFANSNEEDEYAFTKAVVYRNIETGEIDSVQIINTEYREFLIIDKNGEISVVNMDEQESEESKKKNKKVLNKNDKKK